MRERPQRLYVARTGEYLGVLRSPLVVVAARASPDDRRHDAPGLHVRALVELVRRFLVGRTSAASAPFK
jgi:hypothetical protein